ncbi:DUF4129 domain-containing protein [Gordonia hongkongensis]|uniref:DUF4129 domain-containing protein n=1 Tax=Gordonia hongkongensis TaxID=1701090 RepID=A0ABT6BMY6_9ACTN|nr:DUF4129 domain-containing protein [Gordonia hongkongensis]MDF6099440.1 DUF4129 domain-containing protein [Gordonia hongkongensis]
MIGVLAAPLDPGNDEARRWAEEELSDSEYQPPEPSWFDRFGERLWEWIADNVFGWFGGSDTLRGIVIVVAIALVLGLVIAVVRHLRRNPRIPRTTAGPPTGSVLTGPARSAADFRSDADAAFAAGRYDECVLAAVRAMARRGIERGLLADEPSLTAHEVAVDLGPRFPTYDSGLRTATDLFDAIAYGDRHASAESARAVLDIERGVSSARPVDQDTVRSSRLAVPR